mgnify:CR=1 FL=1
MGRALELITGFVTAPSTTNTALTLATGNTLTVRSHPFENAAMLLQAWADNQTSGVLRIRSPRLHDQVQGIRLDVLASEVVPLLPRGATQRLFPQDTLVVDLTGSAAAGDIETACLLVYYGDLPGIDSRLLRPEEVMPRIRHIVTVENTLALGTAGGYSGEEAIDAEFDLLRANTDYAILGYLVDAECAAVRYRGPFSGNLGVGGPGTATTRELTRDWFVRMAMDYDLPLIPVFNAADKSNVLIDGAQDENGIDVTVTTILAQLDA